MLYFKQCNVYPFIDFFTNYFLSLSHFLSVGEETATLHLSTKGFSTGRPSKGLYTRNHAQQRNGPQLWHPTIASVSGPVQFVLQVRTLHKKFAVLSFAYFLVKLTLKLSPFRKMFLRLNDFGES